MMQICSLLPSATEIVFSLGLGQHLVGVTHECDYPPEAARLPVVTRSNLDSEAASSREIHTHISRSLHSGSSIYHLDQERLASADPGLILTQELCDVCAVAYGEVRRAVRQLEGERTILSLEPSKLEGILQTIVQVAQHSGVPERGDAVVAGLRERIERVSEKASQADSQPSVLALEWLDPPMAAGHWVPEMVRLAGGRDGLGQEGSPSFSLSWEAVAGYDPERIVLMPCGFTLKRTLKEARNANWPEEWNGLQAVRSGQVYAVDGSAYFNRPGPRIVDGLEILSEILHPDIFKRLSPPDAWQKVGE